MLKPEIEFLLVSQPFKHHQFVIADERHKVATSNQFQQDFNDTARVRAAVHEVSERDDHVVLFRRYFVYQSLECVGATVYVANCNNTGH